MITIAVRTTQASPVKQRMAYAHSQRISADTSFGTVQATSVMPSRINKTLNIAHPATSLIEAPTGSQLKTSPAAIVTPFTRSWSAGRFRADRPDAVPCFSARSTVNLHYVSLGTGAAVVFCDGRACGRFEKGASQASRFRPGRSSEGRRRVADHAEGILLQSFAGEERNPRRQLLLQEGELPGRGVALSPSHQGERPRFRSLAEAGRGRRETKRRQDGQGSLREVSRTGCRRQRCSGNPQEAREAQIALPDHPNDPVANHAHTEIHRQAQVDLIEMMPRGQRQVSVRNIVEQVAGQHR